MLELLEILEVLGTSESEATHLSSLCWSNFHFVDLAQHQPYIDVGARDHSHHRHSSGVGDMRQIIIRLMFPQWSQTTALPIVLVS